MGSTFLLVREDSERGGVAWRLTQSSMASWLIGVPRRSEQGAAGSAGVFSEPCGQTATVSRSSGVTRSFLPCHGIPGGGRRPGGCRAVEAGQFTGAQARGDGDQHQGVVAAACPGAGSGVRRRAAISSSPSGYDGGPESLAGDGQDAGDVVGVLGCCARRRRTRVDGGNRSSGSGRVAPLMSRWSRKPEISGALRSRSPVPRAPCPPWPAANSSRKPPVARRSGWLPAGLELPHQPSVKNACRKARAAS